jgi:hypothetical protein
MGYAIIKNKQKPTPAPEQVQYATAERFVEFAETLVDGGNYKNLEEFLANAKKQWTEFLEFEEGKLTDEIVAAAAPKLEHFFKKENT